MSDTFRYRKEFHKPRYFAVDSATVIEQGDLVWLDTDDVKPASDYSWDTDLETTQRSFAAVFVGVAMDKSGSGDTDDIQVNTAGIHELTCASATFEIGDDVAPADTGSSGLEDQKVVGVTDPTLSIGKVSQREGSAVTAVNIDVIPGVISGGSFDTGLEIITALEAVSAGSKLSADAIEDGSTNHVFTASDDTKLGGIEASADVTDAANVAAAGAMMDSDITEDEGILRKTGAGAYEALKTNLSASAAPTVSDDADSDYAVGSLWIDTTNDAVYRCVDSSSGAAVWVQMISTANASKVENDNGLKKYFAVVTAVAGDDTAGYVDFDTGWGAAPDWFSAHVLRAGVNVTEDAAITALGGGDLGKIRVADGGATYAVTADDVIYVQAIDLS